MKEGLLYHSYFEKAMRLQYTIMQRAAMSQHQKMAILGNELVRRLKNIHPEVLKEEIVDVVEHYIGQIKNSGYFRKEAKEIIACGIVGWRRGLERRQRRGQDQYLEAGDTLEERARKKLLEKTSWYNPDLKRKAEDAASKFKYNPPGKKRKHQGGNKHHEGQQGKQGQGQPQKSKIKGVMFIPYTEHSELASRLRDNEQKMEQQTGYRIKIV